jgi:hypothetical protein
VATPAIFGCQSLRFGEFAAMNRVVLTTAGTVSWSRAGWRVLALTAGQILCGAGLAMADEPAGERSVDVAACIGQLASPQFAQREDAARQLVQAGRAALPPLERAIAAGDLEVATRAVEIVREMMDADDEELTAAARRFLERLAEQDVSPVARLAESALEFQLVGMAQAAREQLEACGVVIRDRGPLGGGRGLEVEFNTAWRGTVDDWRQLPLLRGVGMVSVHGVKIDEPVVAVLGRLRTVRRLDLFGTGIDDAQATALRGRLPETEIDIRKGGKLGVGCDAFGGPCVITLVQPGSAADRAGIRPGDGVVAANGDPVGSFAALTAKLAEHGPGDPVKLAVVRQAADGPPEKFERTVNLDAW